MIAYNFEIVDGSNLALTGTGNYYDIIHLHGTVALTVNWGVTYTETPKAGQTFKFIKTAAITLGGNTVTILGTAVPAHLALVNYEVTAIYSGAAWLVDIKPNFASLVVDEGNIVANAVTETKIEDLAVTTNKVNNLAITTAKIDTDAVTTAKVLDKNITIAKVEDIAANTLLGNFTAGATTLQALPMAASTIMARLAAGNVKACSVAEMQTLLSIVTTALASGQMLVGSAGNVATARTISGAIAIDNVGASTLADNIVTSLKTTQRGNLSGADGPLACAVVTGSDFKALLDGAVNDLIDILTSDIIVRVDVVVQTASGVANSVINIGPDNVLTGAAADTDGYVTLANAAVAGKYSSDNATYSGAYLDFGSHTAVGSGSITIQSWDTGGGIPVDLTASAIVGAAIVYYIPK